MEATLLSKYAVFLHIVSNITIHQKWSSLNINIIFLILQSIFFMYLKCDTIIWKKWHKHHFYKTIVN